MGREINCTCFQAAPCSFCEGLDAEEADAYWSGGAAGLRRLWNKREGGEEPEAPQSGP